MHRAILDHFQRLLEWVLHIRPDGNGRGRVFRYLERRKYLRLDVVRRLGSEHRRVTEPVSPEEMAAIALLWCDVLPVSDRSERLSDAIRDGWFDGFGDRFYKAVVTTAREVDIIGLTGHTHGILRLGALAARILQDPEWADRFDKAQAELARSRQRPWFRGLM